MNAIQKSFIKISAILVLLVMVIAGCTGAQPLIPVTGEQEEPLAEEATPTAEPTVLPAPEGANALFADADAGGAVYPPADTIMRTRFVSVNAALLRAETSPVVLNLFPDLSFNVVFNRSEVKEDLYTWYGVIEGVEMSNIVFTLNPDGSLLGSVYTPGGHFEIAPFASVYVVKQINSAAFAPDAPPLEIPQQPAELDGQMLAQGEEGEEIFAQTDSPDIIDVVVVYTAAARAAAAEDNGKPTTDAGPIDNYVNQMFATTNLTFTNSNVVPSGQSNKLKLRQVYKGEIAYTETGVITDDLTNLKGTGDGNLDSVHTLRTQYGGDIAILITENGGGYCSRAFTIVDGAEDVDKAFAVVDLDCATNGDLSFAYAAGNLLGARADWTYDAPYNPPATSFNHGYVDVAGRWRTVMTANNLCTTAPNNFQCERIPYWSSPDNSYTDTTDPVNSGIMGVKPGSGNYADCNYPSVACADNRKTLQETATIVANFKAAVNMAPPAASLLTPADCAVGNPNPKDASGCLIYTNISGSWTRPTYSWNAVSTASHYRMVVKKGDTEVRNTGWVVPSGIPAGASSAWCNDTTCSFAETSSVIPDLVGTDYSLNWTVKVETCNDTFDRNCNTGPFNSDTATFRVIPKAGASTLSSPANGSSTSFTIPTFSWTQVTGGINEYVFTLKKANGTTIFTQTYADGGTECTGGNCSVKPAITALSNADNSHRWTVQTSNLAGNGETSTADFSVIPPLPPTLSSPSGTLAAGVFQPTYTWTRSGSSPDYDGATSYRLVVTGGTAVDTTVTAAGACSGSTCSTAPLVSLTGGNHDWKVAGINTAGTGSFSAMTNMIAPVPGQTALSSPSNGASVTTSPQTFTWTAQAEATGYELELTRPNASTNTVTVSGGASNSTSVALDGGAGSYSWRVRAKNNNSSVYGAWSTARSLILFTPGAPGSLTITGTPTVVLPSVYSATATFSWGSVANATHYQLLISGPASYSYNSGWITGFSQTVTNLALGNGYTWTVQSKYDNGAGGVALGSIATGTGFNVVVPAQPTITAPNPESAYSNGKIVAWSASGATQYQFEFVSNPGSMCTTTYGAAWSSNTQATVNFTDDLGATSPRTCTWQVKARNSFGESTTSSLGTINVYGPTPTSVTMSGPASGIYKGVSVGTVAYTQEPVFTWSAASAQGPLTYYLEVQDAGSTPIANSGWISGTTWQQSVPIAAGSYKYQLHAKGGFGYTSNSVSGWITFTVSAPAAFTYNSPNSGTSSASTPPTLRWNSSVGAVTYDVTFPSNPDTFCGCSGGTCTGLTATQVVSTFSTNQANTSNRTCSWSVTAVNSVGSTTITTPVRTIVSSIPPAPGFTTPMTTWIGTTSGSPGSATTKIPTYNWSAPTAQGASKYYCILVERDTSATKGLWNSSVPVLGNTGCTSESPWSGGWSGANVLSVVQPSELSQGEYYRLSLKTKADYGIGAWSAYRYFIVPTIGTPGLSSPVDNIKVRSASDVPSLSWGAVGGATNYNLDFPTGASVCSSTYNHSGLTATVTFAPGRSELAARTCTWSVQAYNAELGIGSWSAARTISIAGPLAPGSLTITTSPSGAVAGTTVYDNTPTYNWAAPAGQGTIYYKVELEKNTGSWVAVDNSGEYTLSNTSWTYGSNLDNNGVYRWRVTAQSDYGIDGSNSTSAWQPSTAGFTVSTPTDAPALSAPTNPIYAASQSLSWTPAGSAGTQEVTAYDLSVNGVTTGYASVVSQASCTPTCSYTLGSLAVGTYNIKVRARNAVGPSETWSSQQSFTVSAPPAPALSSPANGAAIYSAQPQFSWGAVAQAASYTLTITGTGATTYNYLASGIAAGTTTHDLPLANKLSAGTYQWTVASVSSLGSNVSGARSLTVSAPGAAAITSPKDSQKVYTKWPTYRWVEAANASAYKVWIETTGGTKKYESAWLSTACSAGVCSATHPTTPADTQLALGETYHWRVQTQSAAGDGAWSDWGGFTLSLPEAIPQGDMLNPPQQTPLYQIDDNNENTYWPVFTWKAVSGSASSYVISFHDTRSDLNEEGAPIGWIENTVTASSVCTDNGDGTWTCRAALLNTFRNALVNSPDPFVEPDDDSIWKVKPINPVGDGTVSAEVHFKSKVTLPPPEPGEELARPMPPLVVPSPVITTPLSRPILTIVARPAEVINGYLLVIQGKHKDGKIYKYNTSTDAAQLTWIDPLSEDVSCTETRCTVRFPDVALSGTYKFWLAARNINPASGGEQTGAQTMGRLTIVAPAAPTLTNTPPEIAAPRTPTYVFNQSAGATAYLLEVFMGTGRVFSRTLDVAKCVAGTDTTCACTVDTCSVTPTGTGTALKNGGVYSWRVTAQNPVGWSPKSASAAFMVLSLEKPTATTPNTPATAQRPKFTWVKQLGPIYYNLRIEGPTAGKVALNQRVQFSKACVDTADPTNCSVTPAITLGGGEYTWTVQPWNYTWGETSDPLTFSVEPVKPVVNPVIRSGGLAYDPKPVIQWGRVSGADYYNLTVTKAGVSVSGLSKRYTSAAACDADVDLDGNANTCAAQPVKPLPAGTYTVRVMAMKGATLTPRSPWSDTYTFTVAAPTGSTLIAPVGGITETLPVFTWSPVSFSTYYYLTVNQKSGSSSAKTILSIKLDAADPAVCPAGGGNCTYTPLKALKLSEVDYTWQVRAFSGAAMGTISSAAFMLTGPGSAPANTEPAASTTLSSIPTFKWDYQSGVVKYIFFLKGPGNLETDPQVMVIRSSFKASTICNKAEPGKCTYKPAALPRGGTYTWRVMAYDTQPQAWSAETSFVYQPVVPASFQVAAGETDTNPRPSLSWSASEGATHYELKYYRLTSFKTANGTRMKYSSLSTYYRKFTQEAACVSDGDGDPSTCHIIPPYPLKAGDYQVALNALKNTTRSQTKNLLIRVVSPATPLLITPADDATGVDFNPVYTWNAVTDASKYLLSVKRSGAKATYINLWVNSSDYCSGLTCAIPANSKANRILGSTYSYEWSVTAASAAGSLGPRSVWNTFTVKPLAEVTLLEPADGTDLETNLPTFKWQRAEGALKYWLVATGSNGARIVSLNLSSTSVGCFYVTQTVCTKKATARLGGSTYHWKVYPWNAVYGENTGDGWSYSIQPFHPELTSPLNNVSYLIQNPDIRWESVSNTVTHYSVEVRKGAKKITPLSKVYTSAEACTNDGDADPLTCRIDTTAAAFLPGAYTVRVQSQVIDGAGKLLKTSLWSPTRSFKIVVPAVPVVLSPSGSGAGTSPDFTWYPVEGATQYQLSLKGSAGDICLAATGNCIFQAADVCEVKDGVTICSTKNAPVLTEGDWKWSIRAGSSAGYSLWAEYVPFTP